MKTLIALVFIVPIAYQAVPGLAGKTSNLIPYLDALQFRNGPSYVYADRSFGWQQFCVLYSEPENVSTIRFGWDAIGLRSYLIENPGNAKEQRSPPAGMRSAVPLGGLGTGSFELRADGSIHEWTIENQSPAGSAKLNHAPLDLAVFGIRVQGGSSSTAKLLRTHPPTGYPGVSSIGYSGSFPVSKLTVHDQGLGEVELDLFAFSPLKPRDYKSSATPAVAFSLRVKNPTKNSVQVSFMLNLPLGIQSDTARLGEPYASFKSPTLNPTQCSRLCVLELECMSWQVVTSNETCLLFNDVPPHAWHPGTTSGQKNTWVAYNSMLTLNRPGNYPQSGNTTILTEKGASFMVSNSFSEIWKQFAEHGYLTHSSKSFGDGFYGAASLSCTLEPGKEQTLTMVLGWFYPNRDFTEVILGNYYGNLFKSSEEVALYFSHELPSALQGISGWHASMILDDDEDDTSVQTLPVWLQDVLVNGLSFLRSGMYFRDGRWRQFEAFDCIDVDSVHNDFQREIPYVLFYPDLVENVMRAWARYQSKDGHVLETLEAGCQSRTGIMDSAPPNQRIMGDVTTVFITETYHIYQWTNNSTFLNEMWPHVVNAVDWMIHKGTNGTGLPYRQQCTYDLLFLNKYDHTTFNSFMYVLALRATQELSKIMGDEELLQTVTVELQIANYLISVELWSEEDGYYHAWWDKDRGSPSWLMSDSLYAQVWAYTLGLGHLDDPKRIISHLMKELEMNDTPYGLRVMATDNPINKSAVGSCPKDNSFEDIEKLVGQYESIWMGASPDWTALQIWLGMDPKTAFQQAEKAIEHVRSNLNDQWNFHGLYSGAGYGLDGLPWCTSHYAFHMVLWHIPFAVSGQYFSAPNATLIFDPKFPCPYKVPFYTPFATGTLRCAFINKGTFNKMKFEIMSTSGDLPLQYLEVSGSRYPYAVTLKQGKLVTWVQNVTRKRF